jgi:hypothetical protein
MMHLLFEFALTEQGWRVVLPLQASVFNHLFQCLLIFSEVIKYESSVKKVLLVEEGQRLAISRLGDDLVTRRDLAQLLAVAPHSVF